jgi:hypothetical protein
MNRRPTEAWLGNAHPDASRSHFDALRHRQDRSRGVPQRSGVVGANDCGVGDRKTRPRSDLLGSVEAG